MGIGVLLLIAGLGFVYVTNMKAPAIVPSEEKTATTSDVLPINTATPANDISDTALDTDLADIDAQLKNLSNDSAQVDAGMNDKPISQII